MASKHQDYKFSVTVHTDHIAVVGCLRALSQVSQEKGDVRIPSGGTKKPDWERNKHDVTFRFTSSVFRQDFVKRCAETLQPGLYHVVKQNDNDPAEPQGQR